MFVLHQKGLLSEYMRRRRLEYSLLTLPDITGRHTSIFLQLASLLRNLPVLFGFIRKNKIDLVHTHDARMHLTWTLAARLAGVAHIWHQRTVWSAGRLSKLLVLLSSQVIVISQFAKKSLPKPIRTASEVVSNPVENYCVSSDISNIRASLISELDCGNDCKLVTTVGNLIAVKQPMLFVEAALDLLDKTNQKICFLVVGEDREGFLPKMEARIREAGHESSFRFLGFREDAAEIICASDLLVATSKADAFGRTLVEAMFAGVPVVATNAGGHAEILQHGITGCLVPDNAAQALSVGAYDLLTNLDLRNRVITAALQSANRYSPGPHLKHILNIYDRVLQ